MRPGVFVRDLALSGSKLRIASRVDESAVFELRRVKCNLFDLDHPIGLHVDVVTESGQQNGPA